MSESSWYSESF